MIWHSKICLIETVDDFRDFGKVKLFIVNITIVYELKWVQDK